MNFNFELILFYATLITGLIALADVLYFAPRRKRSHAKMSTIVDYSRSFFPVLLIVFFLRSFLFEPFRIPSGSLEPSLLIGDFILVNKYKYGLRLPVVHKKIIENSEPKRGDIIVFRWPPNPSYDFIKRVIGVPGDKVSYINKELFLNGVKVTTKDLDKQMVADQYGEKSTMLEKTEELPGVEHNIYVNPRKQGGNFIDLIVPKGMYFVMGDNRDDSADSRYWGFVPEKNIVGKAILVWMSWDGWEYRVRWDRLGKLINSNAKS